MAVYVVDVLGRAFSPGPVSEEELGPLDNPLGLDAIAGLAPVLLSIITGLLLVVVLVAVAAVLVRLRRARGVERQQLKWFAYAASLLGVAVVVAVVLPSAGSSLVDTVTIMLALAALPVAIGIALLRYRLYEIDRLINRTLVYGVAALFQPARRRVQAVVDRRFNRARYDATRTVEAFSARLRDQVDLDTLSAELLGVVDHTVQPTQASLWLRRR